MIDVYIGIDPGKAGGIAILSEKKVLEAFVMPLVGRELNIPEIASKLKDYKESCNIVACVIEKVHSMPGQGVRSTFNFGFDTGQLQGVIKTLKIPMLNPTPQKWKKVILEGTKKDKEASILYCKNKYPDVSLLPTPRCKKDSDGISDAICMAEFGKLF